VEVELVRAQFEHLVVTFSIEVEERLRGIRPIVRSFCPGVLKAGYPPGVGGRRTLDVVTRDELSVNDEAEFLSVKGPFRLKVDPFRREGGRVDLRHPHASKSIEGDDETVEPRRSKETNPIMAL
jgi:hypothetical protein